MSSCAYSDSATPAFRGLITLHSLLFTLFLTSCGRPSYEFDESKAVYSNFSGEAAFEYVKAIVEMGPRPAGSEALEDSRQFIEGILKAAGWQVKRQSFTEKTRDGEVEFVNLRARFDGSGEGESGDLWNLPVDVLVASHYDTKKFGFEFVGANDPGSSMGALLHLAEVVAKRPEFAGRLELVFFDGEEAFGTSITDNDGLFGSTHYAAQWLKEKKAVRPRKGILLDMVGDRDLTVRAGVEVQVRLDLARAAGAEIDHGKVKAEREKMARQLLSASKDLDVRRHFGLSSSYILDDHVRLNQIAGIPTIDIIDFDYDYWHTPADTLDKISAESIGTVGKTTLLLIEKYLLGGD